MADIPPLEKMRHPLQFFSCPHRTQRLPMDRENGQAVFEAGRAGGGAARWTRSSLQ